MWTPDDFPGADNVPWQLLIRARFAHELDAVVASHVVRGIGAVASIEQTAALTSAAFKALVPRKQTEASGDQVLGVMRALLDWDDWCGTGWPHRWPPRRRSPFDDLSDPITVIAAQKALELVRGVGSPELSKIFGAELEQLAGLGRQRATRT